MNIKKNRTQRILVVDDEPIISHVCQRVLSKYGFSVDIAGDGNQAIERIHDRAYSLCILDIRMPGINGFQLHKYLSDNRPELSQNTIFITGDITSTQVCEFLNTPKKVYLEKPFSPDDLIAAVEMALN